METYALFYHKLHLTVHDELIPVRIRQIPGGLIELPPDIAYNITMDAFNSVRHF